jgi:hypothetical protein
MSRADEYYTNGFVTSRFRDPTNITTVLSALCDPTCDRHPFFWEQKYRNTLDLRPNAHRYDPAILEALLEGGIPALLSDVIAPDMVLVHTQVRLSFPGPSYMDWHRDTYAYGNATRVGNFPSVHKVIFYPLLGRPAQPKLQLRVGSHRRNFDDQDADHRGVVDMPLAIYHSSDDEFILFDTSIMHAVIPEPAGPGSIRVIYSFQRRAQFERTLATNELHAEQVRMYERML